MITVSVLMTMLGLYLAIGVVVAIDTYVRGREEPWRIIDEERPYLSFMTTVLIWPAVRSNQRELAQRYQRLSEGPIRTDWVVTEYQVPEVWIKDRVARRPQEFDWKVAGLTPTDNPGVKDLLDMMRVGDELWEFSSDTASWQRLAGRAGYVLLRKGKQIAHLTTLMN